MGKIPYTIFLAVASVKEIAQIFSLGSNGLVELTYLVFFVYLIMRMFSNSLTPWIWKEGFAIVGFSALIYLILLFVGVPDGPIKIIDSFVCLVVWIRSLVYLNNYKHDENIGEV